MYLKFSNFGGTNLSWGDKPWSQNGDKCRMGGLTKFLPDGGTPHLPQDKNPAMYLNQRKGKRHLKSKLSLIV